MGVEENIVFPFNSVCYNKKCLEPMGSYNLAVSLAAIHDQLCIIADQQREIIKQNNRPPYGKRTSFRIDD